MLRTPDREALVQFMKDWVKPMKHIFDQRFGKNKIGYILITLDTGNEPTVNYITNLRDRDFKRCLQMLADKVNETHILTPTN